MEKLKVMVVFGTRPEAIKMAPLVLELQKHSNCIETITVVTAQHRQMLDQVLETFRIQPNYDLDIMGKNQSLLDITAKILQKFDPIVKKELPDMILVHGDTTTTFVASLVAFYNQVRIGHVEAGLRTFDKYSPFPEEMNRQMTDNLADLYIAYSLIEAAKQWPDKAQEYEGQAKSILIDILRFNYNEDTGVLKVGNWAKKNTDFYYLMRTSDTLPHYFQVFYNLTGDKQWLDIKDKMLGQLEQISSQSETGLLPDFIWVEKSGARVADANTIESQYDGAYSYNACRLPYHLAQSRDERSQKIVQKMMTFFMKEKRIYAGYDLQGHALNQYQAGSFLAPITYAANTVEGNLKLLQQNKYIFTQDLPLDNYYDATMITMIALELF